MTVSEMRKLLKGLPSQMQIVMPLDDDNFVTVCAENSMVIELQEFGEDENDDSGDVTEVLLLVGCGCNNECEIELGDINSQPELN